MNFNFVNFDSVIGVIGVIVFFINLIIDFAVIGLSVTLVILIFKALIKYLKSDEVRKEKSNIKLSLGQVLKTQREECKMTQEFVAEAIGVSRQAVSKWENGASDPSTSNLIALAKLFNISAEELISKIK